ncbi:MAG: class II aldolase/adducin family protein [Burkholderiales bacterium]|jgi:ribulose-5-phosphate 4-epimerase/fuculose-1-phosphate aldolase|nr:class II aldolase/adducin family protein [Burkholderiales bacterium]
MNAPDPTLARSVRDQVSPEEWQTRVDLAACYRLMALHGMTEMIANHISMRVPGTENEFLLNPYGMLYDEMTASSMIRIDVDGNVLFNASGYGINKAGYVIHSAIHKARHDVGCIIHTHTLAGMSVSAMKVGLMPIAQSSMRFADVAYHDYEGIALRLDEQARLVASLGGREAMVLRNHGLLTVGPTIPECFNNMWRLERACQLQVMALSCNTELQMPPPEAVRYSQEALGPQGGLRLGLREWPALLRKLDRIDPSYRD